MSDDETQPVNQPAVAVEPHPAPYAPAYAAAPAPRSGRGGLLLAGLALAIALVAGTAGFALGNVTADDGRDGPMRRAGRPRRPLRRRRPPPGRLRSGPAADAVSRARLAGMDAAGWDERYAASELVWSAEPNRFVAEVCADLAPGRALDLAAGEGRNAIWLAQRGWDVTATDFSAVGLDKGRRLAQQLTGHAGIADRIAWVVADATTTDWADDHDLVVVAYLQLVESERREAVLRGFAALQSGGRFVWVAHDSSNLTEGTGGPQDPSVLMTADDVLIDLTGEPFEVIRAERVARPVGDATAYDCLVVLERD